MAESTLQTCRFIQVLSMEEQEMATFGLVLAVAMAIGLIGSFALWLLFEASADNLSRDKRREYRVRYALAISGVATTMMVGVILDRLFVANTTEIMLEVLVAFALAVTSIGALSLVLSDNTVAVRDNVQGLRDMMH